MAVNRFIIDGRRKKPFKWVEFLFTFAGWSYLLFFLGNIVLTLTLWFFNIGRFYDLFQVNTLGATLRVVTSTAGIAVLFFIILSSWRRYNLKKFGGLRRRRFPAEFDAKATAEYFTLPLEKVIEYQSSRLIVLERTII